MSTHEHRPGNSPKVKPEIGNGLGRPPTEPAGEGSPGPLRNTKDWRPVFEQKERGPSWALGRDSRLKRVEAYHERAVGSQEVGNEAQIRRGYWTKATTPSAGFDASPIEKARKQRVETLKHSVERSENLQSVVRKNDNPNTRSPDESKEERLDELPFLGNYVATPWKRVRDETETVGSVERQIQAADPSPSLLRTTEETASGSAMPTSPHTVAPVTAKRVRAVLRECSPRRDIGSGLGAGDSDASTAISASNATIWRCQSKYDDSAEEEQQQQQQRGKKGRRSLLDYTGTLTELGERGHVDTTKPEGSRRRDSVLAGLRETQQGVAGREGEAKSSTADRRSSQPTFLASFPVPDRSRRHRHNRLGHEGPVSGPAVLDPTRFRRTPTRAEKGKWPAKCGCSECQARQGRRVHFDESAMDKAEEGPGLSQEGFVKMMREQRKEEQRRAEAAERGEGCSFWETTDPGGQIGQDMYCNPRPAPPVPVRRLDSIRVMEGGRAQKRRVDKRDVGEPMEQNSSTRLPRVFQPAREFRGPVSRTGNVAAPQGGEDPMAAFRTLSRRFKRSRKARGGLDGV